MCCNIWRGDRGLISCWVPLRNPGALAVHFSTDNPSLLLLTQIYAALIQIQHRQTLKRTRARVHKVFYRSKMRGMSRTFCTSNSAGKALCFPSVISPLCVHMYPVFMCVCRPAVLGHHHQQQGGGGARQKRSKNRIPIFSAPANASLFLCPVISLE